MQRPGQVVQFIHATYRVAGDVLEHVGYNALREIPFPGLSICEWACGIVGRRVVNAEP